MIQIQHKTWSLSIFCWVLETARGVLPRHLLSSGSLGFSNLKTQL